MAGFLEKNPFMVDFFLAIFIRVATNEVLLSDARLNSLASFRNSGAYRRRSVSSKSFNWSLPCNRPARTSSSAAAGIEEISSYLMLDVSNHSCFVGNCLQCNLKHNQ